MFEFFRNIDWNAVAESLKTENIIKGVSNIDPAEFFSDPFVIVSCIVAIGVMFFFKLEKTFAFVAGVIVLWIGIRYALPKTEVIQLADIGSFAAIFTGVIGFWIYMFFIKD
jgi:hypothetical protein